MQKLLALSLIGTLALASCGGPSAPVTPPVTSALSGTVVEGRIEADSNKNPALRTSAWTGGAGTVTLYAVNSSAEVSAPTPLTSTGLGADGRFAFATLPIPAASTLGNFKVSPSANCTGTVSVSDPAVRVTSAVFFVSAQKTGIISLISLDGAAQTISEGTLIYADRAVIVKGRRTCTDPGNFATTDINLQLASGWNMTSSTFSFQDDLTVTIRNGTPAGAQWILLDGSLTGQRLNSISSFSLFR